MFSYHFGVGVLYPDAAVIIPKSVTYEIWVHHKDEYDERGICVVVSSIDQIPTTYTNETEAMAGAFGFLLVMSDKIHWVGVACQLSLPKVTNGEKSSIIDINEEGQGNELPLVSSLPTVRT